MSLGRLQNLSRTALFGVPDGPEGTRFTLEVMRKFARDARTDPNIRQLAIQLTQGLPNEDFRAEANALFEFVRDRIRYVQDVNEVETVATPQITLELGAGDCDDKATLLAALLESIGHPARFAAIAFAPDNFEHVLVETRIGDRWIPMETTKNVPMGWYPDGVVSKMLRHV